jgi:uncharacterized protein (DUF2336 family)
MLADVCLDEALNVTLREQELINELIDRLLLARTPAVRAHLIEKFADASRMPRHFAKGFANDDIEVARNVLRHCTTLTDEDLISVVTTRSKDHAQAIAQRDRISEAVADALVVTGDVKIMQLVAENLGATLNQKCVDILTDAARFTMELREPIIKREEMTAEAATRLYWWVSQDLRRYALKRFGITSGQIDAALSNTIDQLLGYYELEKNNEQSMIQVADWLSERQVITLNVLPQVLRLGHFCLFNILLSRLTHLSLSLVNTIVSETGGRGLAVIAKAIGIDKSGFVSIFLLSRGARSGEQIVHPRELSYALAAFDRLTPITAQNLLHTWKKDPTYFSNRQEDAVLEG